MEGEEGDPRDVGIAPVEPLGRDRVLRGLDQIGGARQFTALLPGDVEHVCDRSGVDAHRVGPGESRHRLSMRDPLERQLRNQDHRREGRQGDHAQVLDPDHRGDADDQHPQHRRAEVDELVADQGRRSVALVEGREGEPREGEVERPHRDPGRHRARARSRRPAASPPGRAARRRPAGRSRSCSTVATKPGEKRGSRLSTNREIRSGTSQTSSAGSGPAVREGHEGDDQRGAEERERGDLEAAPRRGTRSQSTAASDAIRTGSLQLDAGERTRKPTSATRAGPRLSAIATASRRRDESRGRHRLRARDHARGYKSICSCIGA